MAKHDAGTPSNDESADEVADQFSSAKPRSKNKADDARVRTPSKTNSSRKSQKADEIEVTSDDEEPSKGKADDDDDEEDEAGEDEYEIERIVDVEVGAIDEVCTRLLTLLTLFIPVPSQSIALLIILRAFSFVSNTRFSRCAGPG